MSEREAVDCKL